MQGIGTDFCLEGEWFERYNGKTHSHRQHDSFIALHETPSKLSARLSVLIVIKCLGDKA